MQNNDKSKDKQRKSRKGKPNANERGRTKDSGKKEY
jgi:hypothetical protein